MLNLKKNTKEIKVISVNIYVIYFAFDIQAHVEEVKYVQKNVLSVEGMFYSTVHINIIKQVSILKTVT